MFVQNDVVVVVILGREKGSCKFWVSGHQNFIGIDKELEEENCLLEEN